MAGEGDGSLVCRQSEELRLSLDSFSTEMNFKERSANSIMSTVHNSEAISTHMLFLLLVCLLIKRIYSGRFRC